MTGNKILISALILLQLNALFSCGHFDDLHSQVQQTNLEKTRTILQESEVLVAVQDDDNGKKIDLSDKSLITIPTWVPKTQNLTTLLLNKNKIKNIPTNLASAKRLIELDLSYNELEDLNDVIGSFKRLTILDCKNNFIEKISPAIGNLKQLFDLSLDFNNLS